MRNKQIITGVPENDWSLSLPEGVCVDVVPWGEEAWVARPYGFNDPFKGATQAETTLFMGQSLPAWAAQRGISLPESADIQNAPLFPVCPTVEALGIALRWMISEPTLTEGKALWLTAQKVSANEISDQANLQRLVAQREAFRKADWSLLAQNQDKSVFYQLDLADAAREFHCLNIPAPAVLPADAPQMQRIHNRMLRAQIAKYNSQPFEEEETAAFGLLRDGLLADMYQRKVHPTLHVYSDQIVWGRSPVRIDMAGGWTDTPPYSLYAGGHVVNLAIELNGQPPLQVYIKPCQEPHIVLRSIDMGAMEVVNTYEELQ